MPILNINDEIINFPNTSASPQWSEAIIQFAEAVEAALSGLISTGDVTKQFFNLDASHNPGVDVTLTGLSFSSSTVRAAFIRYSVYRDTTTDTVTEQGNINIVYSDANPVDSKWEIQREYVGDAQITFAIDDAGQFTFTTATIPGASHSGKISFVGQALAQ